MKIEIIAGSHRPASQTGKVGRYIESAYRRAFPNGSAGFTDLGETPLPLWDSEFDARTGKWGAWPTLSARLEKADGFVILTPEWGGMATPAIKNFFLLCSSKELGHKPALLVSVSAGRSGSYPISELRQFSGKNNKVVYIPDHLIIRGVETVLNSPPGGASGGPEDDITRRRIEHSLLVLEAYARALHGVRSTAGVIHREFMNGM